MKFREIPPQPLICTRFREPNITHVYSRAHQEVLGWHLQPAQHEERVLAGGRIAKLQPLHCPATQRVITTALGVEIRGLVPQEVCKLVPPKPPSRPLFV
jgi:hypothetical protein